MADMRGDGEASAHTLDKVKIPLWRYVVSEDPREEHGEPEDDEVVLPPVLGEAVEAGHRREARGQVPTT